MRLWIQMKKWLIKMMITKFLSFDQFCYYFDWKNRIQNIVILVLRRSVSMIKMKLDMIKNNLKVNKVPKTGLLLRKFAQIPTIKHFSLNWMSWLNFSGEFTSFNQKCVFDILIFWTFKNILNWLNILKIHLRPSVTE